MDITIVIPTHRNRTKYLRRALYFYSSYNFSGRIIICDSSDDNIIKKNKLLINEFNKLSIKHIIYQKGKFPNESYVNADVSDKIETNYVCWAGDDDFQILDALKICIEYLNYNPDYTGVHGTKLRYTIYKNIIKDIKIIAGQYLDVEDPVFRFRGYMRSCTSPQYHVIRTNIWKKIYQHGPLIEPNIKFLVSEILPCSLYYIFSKVKRIDNLIQYIMEDSADAQQNVEPDYIIKGINSSGWGECSTIIRDIIISALNEKGVSKIAATQAFDEEYNLRILSHFKDQFFAIYGDNTNKFVNEYNEFVKQYDRKLDEQTIKEAITMAIPAIKEYLLN